ncbi:hypothetical protein NFI96_001233 [Prochilodus magdalenae]|nr:hypothetical protein NFI96_001233 [Prochilodus magdalenae]
MSKPSRLTRPSSATPGSKLPSPRREMPASRPRTSQEDKLMRTGSEGNLSRHSTTANGATPPRKDVEDTSHHKSRSNPPKHVIVTTTQQPSTHHRHVKLRGDGGRSGYATRCYGRTTAGCNLGLNNEGVGQNCLYQHWPLFGQCLSSWTSRSLYLPVKLEPNLLFLTKNCCTCGDADFQS